MGQNLKEVIVPPMSHRVADLLVLSIVAAVLPYALWVIMYVLISGQFSGLGDLVPGKRSMLATILSSFFVSVLVVGKVGTLISVSTLLLLAFVISPFAGVVIYFVDGGFSFDSVVFGPKAISTNIIVGFFLHGSLMVPLFFLMRFIYSKWIF